jgi:peptidoglycan/LPS O-acetylase OafA/YrhL
VWQQGLWPWTGQHGVTIFFVLSGFLTLCPPTMTSPQASSARIPTLEGWRGVAILLVLNSHLCGNGILPHPAWWWVYTGQHGVTIFFVLSGYLITSKLLEGPITLKRFYVRRLFRLMPAAWAYLTALLLFGRLAHVSLLSASDLRACLLFYRNFTGGAIGMATAHFWSLSLEEQFYLAWPCILLAVGFRRCRWIAAAGAFACAAWRWTHWAHYSNQALCVETQVRADALMIGCLMALLLHHAGIRSFAKRCSRVWAIPALVVTFFAVWRFAWLPPLYESVAIAGLITASVLHPESILARPLNLRPLAWLGTVSYSLYIWQQIFMQPGANALHASLAITIFALGSYYCIELPCVRLGHRLTRHTSRTPEELHQVPA